ncbi:ABC transporter permease [Pseudohalocynthiibacter aestuariivivens]|jgi:peptide/nickel transport system permease protein|uniref:ABC transporter permease n=1 Tax=Pseudohalocynthiibacter aestuariivivens TaxID=1591409 RepID=A0ABV5JHS8_9RHOB|nr:MULTISPECIES: ABC transporter permease [Pseudohalocynthiibacter]MBS9718996.1 ABC transporter permease [Pseudohalocynthiibacter aestuariivivens]MCK0104573.1 ABC transporter permease [Pseudohalocynthiibacter sp. F2068]
MWWYLLKRLGLSVVIVLMAIAALFVMLHSIPGDPVSIALGPRATPEIQAAYAEKMHLDQPLAFQFLIFVGNVLQGDLGTDVFSNRSVGLTLSEQLPYTITLAVAALGWAIALGIPLGCLSAIWPNSWIDRVTGVLSVGTIAVPSFLVSIWAILIFAISLRWLPVLGAGDEGDIIDQLRHLILPAFAVGLGWVGYLARMVRASMLEVMGENYIRSARAFGLTSRMVVFRYALPVAVLPTITLIGVGFGGLLSGTVFAEIIFSRPGIGRIIYDMVLARNFPVVQGAVLVTIVLYVVVTLIADIIVSWLDPRVRDSL